MSAGAEKPAGQRPGRAGGGRDPALRPAGPIVLYRCPTPTNFLCPCGAVARRLGRLEVEHRVVRLPYQRSARPEIEELTGQRLIPVIVDGDEVVHDSRRILQYLDWAYAKREKGNQGRPEAGSSDD